MHHFRRLDEPIGVSVCPTPFLLAIVLEAAKAFFAVQAVVADFHQRFAYFDEAVQAAPNDRFAVCQRPGVFEYGYEFAHLFLPYMQQELGDLVLSAFLAELRMRLVAELLLLGISIPLFRVYTPFTR
jgi:hypothetical protein